MNIIKKNSEYIVEILDNGINGEGIAKIDNFTIFVPGTIKGEKVKIIIVKVLKSYGYGKCMEIIEKSKYRTEEDCSTYKRCGGCDLRHIEYDKTLDMKQEMVQNLINKTFGANNFYVEKTIGMGNPYNYRNKAQYPVGINKSGEPIIGVYAKRSHEIIQMNGCMIQNRVAEQIAFVIYKFLKENNIPAYDEKNQKGLFRHIVIKTGIRTHEIMCILVINGKEIPKEKELVELLIKTFPEIKSIVKNINMKNTNVILGKENINIYGDGSILDVLGDYTFKISPMSFYQVNPIQAEILYNTAIEMADLNKDEILFDLYCGIGTIGIFASKYVKQVYGIEIVEQAIEDAKENAKMNGIDNIEFMTGDVEESLEVLIKKNNVYPDVIVVDPPRKGLDNNTISNILAIEPKKVIYISCNPATFVRDVKILSEKYDMKKVQPVDMFPFTSHCEVVVVLNLN